MMLMMNGILYTEEEGIDYLNSYIESSK